MGSAIDFTSHYRVEGGVALIEVSVAHLRQLFNSLDPAPFLEKELDDDAAAYISAAAREIGQRPVKLVVHLPAGEATGSEADGIGDAVRNFFAYRLWSERRVLRHTLRLGWASAAIGLTFLFACLGARQLLAAHGSSLAAEILAEGLLISGWVAMWRPIQVFLYDWWPIRRTCRLYERLAALEVELRPPP
jgi:hypothetical protein